MRPVTSTTKHRFEKLALYREFRRYCRGCYMKKVKKDYLKRDSNKAKKGAQNKLTEAGLTITQRRDQPNATNIHIIFVQIVSII